MRTHWYCERCEAEGTVRHAMRAGVYEVMSLLEDDHTRKSLACERNHALNYVRSWPAAEVRRDRGVHEPHGKTRTA